MRKLTLLLILLVASIISACSSVPQAAPFAMTPTPKCKDNICIQEAVVIADEQNVTVMFAVTNQDGQVDPDRPPRFDSDYSFNVYYIESGGVEKSLFDYQPRAQFQCMVTNRAVLFKDRLLNLCMLVTPQSTKLVKVQPGDIVRVILKEFDYEQRVAVHAPVKIGDPNVTSLAIADAFLTGDEYGSISATTFPQTQRTLHLFIVLVNASPTTKIRVVWTAVDVGDAALANSKLGEMEQAPYGDMAIFTVSAPRSGVWPVGKYKAEIFLDGTFDRTIEYTIESSGPTN